MSKRKSKKNKSYVGLLLTMWVFFIAAIAAFGIFVFKNMDQLEESVSTKEEHIYTVNSDPEVNTLIKMYLIALASSDQASLKNCVTTPTQYDNMSLVEDRSEIIKNYENINCYYVPGPEPDSYIVYTIMNITIQNVDSKPLDIYKPFHVVKVDGKYLIDNAAQSQELQDFIAELGMEKDIQELYQMEQDDNQSLAANDPTLAEFMDKLDK